MSGYQAHTFEIPQETIEVARAALGEDNEYLLIRDKLGPLYKDEDFVTLFACRGQPGVSPGLLAMVTILQFMEGLTDRQAAAAVRSRIDWKYVLGLPLKYDGFHYSILSGFRERLLKGEQEALLFDRVLERLKEVGLLSGKGQQRTDSTHVVAAIRRMNRLECVGETMRRVLDDLARLAPEWLLAQISPGWFDRYGARFEAYRLPTNRSEREALQLQIGQDGVYLLTAIYSETAPVWLRELPGVDVMLRVWRQQYYIEGDQVQWRDNQDLPPFKVLIVSPDDIEARNRTKRETNWSGYTAHLTETCHPAHPRIITNMETTPATTADVDMPPTIHQALAAKELLPDEHLVDSGYVCVDHLLESQRDYNIDLLGPVSGGRTWQAKQEQGLAVSCFSIDWDKQSVTCPQDNLSQSWHLRRDKYGHEYIQARFAPTDCHPCPQRAACTKSKRGVRAVSFKPQAAYDMLQTARERQQTDEFKTKYKKRAGIEGTISQGVRTFDLRRSRYLGLAKTHLQHLAIGAAMNLTRVVTWWLAGEQNSSPYRSPFAKLAPVT